MVAVIMAMIVAVRVGNHASMLYYNITQVHRTTFPAGLSFMPILNRTKGAERCDRPRRRAPTGQARKTAQKAHEKYRTSASPANRPAIDKTTDPST